MLINTSEHETLSYLKDVLSELTRENVHVPDKFYNQDDANNAKNPVVWFNAIDETRFSPDIPQEIIEKFKENRVASLEAICYFERTTVKDYASYNGHMPYAATRSREVHGQYFVIDLVEAPEKRPNEDEITTAFRYRQELMGSPYVVKMDKYLKQFGIVYIAEFDPNEIIKKFKRLLENEI